jgi:oxygen-independent coproporphyrinogen III oxidase
MAGIYIHIPFCKQLCYYCDFHFTVSFKQKDRIIDAICKEIELRKNEFPEFVFETIYFGGGTPSVLSVCEIERILKVIRKKCTLVNTPEITFEANPDDLTSDYLSELRNNTGINRLSIGIQSFQDAQLKLMNRRHNALEAINCIDRAKNAGFNNINIDLIYGIPGMTSNQWQNNLDLFLKLDIPHLSAYHLTFEPKTVFSHYLKKGTLHPVNEGISIQQYEMLINFTGNNAFDHYEISNFAKDGLYSKHNLGYWTGKPYIGIGPSAHSFISGQRRWNISVNTKYCEGIEQNTNEYFECEIIDLRTGYNDYILTSLRTKWGIDREFIKTKFGEIFLDRCNKASATFITTGVMIVDDKKLYLSKKGKLIADYVISEMMIVDKNEDKP